MKKNMLLCVLCVSVLLSCDLFDSLKPDDGTDGTSQDGTDGTSEDGTDGSDGTTTEVVDPVFSPASGAVTALTEITISCATDGVTIYYTTDGTEPSTSSNVYVVDNPPLLYEDSTFKAVARKDGVSSAVITAEYTAEPVLDGFNIELESGMRWDYKYTWHHYVNYSYDDEDFTVTKNFSVILGEESQIDGITAYQVTVMGDYSIEWQYLASDNGRLLGSRDGYEFVVLFDAMLGYWAGECFFLDFNGSGDDDLNQMTASVAGDTATVSEGWRFEDDDTAYYPGVGTIYDPDAYSSYSNTTESYESGVGPVGYRDSSGSTSSWESSGDVYTVELLEFTTGVDYQMYSFDGTLALDTIGTRTQMGPVDKIKISNSSSYMRFIVYVEFLTDGYDPVISVLNGDFEYEVTDLNQYAPPAGKLETVSRQLQLVTTSATLGSVEIYKTDSQDGDLYVWVEDTEGRTDGQYKIGVFQIKSAYDDTSIDSYVPGSSISIGLGAYTYSSVEDSTYQCFEPSTSLSAYTRYYFFAIPLSDELDMALCIVDPPDASTTYWYHKVNMNGAGKAEAFYTDLSDESNIAINVFDTDYDTAGDFIFGFGTY